MKKLSFLVGAIAISTAVFAQKPTGGDAPMSLEGQLNIYGADGLNIDWTAPSIRYRYFVKENIAARVTLSIMSDKTTENFFEDEAANSGASGEYITKFGGWGLGIGGEYHFAGTEKLSPYGGLDISFGGASMTTEGSNSDGAGFMLDHSESSEMKMSMLGVNLVGGVDYYFAQNFYFGLELMWGFSSMTTKEGEMTTTDPAPIGTVTVKTNEMKESSMDNAAAAFRLGWRF